MADPGLVCARPLWLRSIRESRSSIQGEVKTRFMASEREDEATENSWSVAIGAVSVSVSSSSSSSGLRWIITEIAVPRLRAGLLSSSRGDEGVGCVMSGEEEADISDMS